jgi:hypothetical protein
MHFLETLSGPRLPAPRVMRARADQSITLAPKKISGLYRKT